MFASLADSMRRGKMADGKGSVEVVILTGI